MIIEIIKHVATNIGLFFILVCIIVIVTLIGLAIYGYFYKRNHKNNKYTLPAQNYQEEKLNRKYRNDLPNCYIMHDILDERNITLDLSKAPQYVVRKMLNILSRNNNVFVIVPGIMDDKRSYNLIKLITYINSNNLCICGIIDTHNMILVSKEYINKNDNTVCKYYIEAEAKKYNEKRKDMCSK